MVMTVAVKYCWYNTEADSITTVRDTTKTDKQQFGSYKSNLW